MPMSLPSVNASLSHGRIPMSFASLFLQESVAFFLAMTPVNQIKPFNSFFFFFIFFFIYRIRFNKRDYLSASHDYSCLNLKQNRSQYFNIQPCFKQNWLLSPKDNTFEKTQYFFHSYVLLLFVCAFGDWSVGVYFCRGDIWSSFVYKGWIHRGR